MPITNEYKKRNTASRLALYASAATFVLSLSGNSIAAEGDEVTLEEIIVTSTKRAVSVRDIPINISAVTGDIMEKLGVTDIVDLGEVVPSVVVSDAGMRTAFINTAINIRGLSVSNGFALFIPAKAAAPVSIYVNDTPLYSNLQLMDIKAVEVMRGPQGTLYGSGSLGGNVRYVMNKPDPEELYAEVTSGLSNTKAASGLNYDTRAILNLPLSENFAMRFNVSYVKEQGFIDHNGIYAREGNEKFNPGALPILADPSDPVGSAAALAPVKDADDADALYIRAAALYENDSFSANFNYFHQELNADSSPLTQLPNAEDDYTNEFASLLPFESTVDMASLELAADLGFATLTSVTSYSDSKARGLFDQTEPYLAFPFYPAVYGNSPRPIIVDESSLHTKTTTVEVRLTSPGGDKIDWLLGAFYQDVENDAFSRQYFPGYTDYSNACFGSGGGFGPPNCGFGTLFGIFPSNGPFELNEANKDLAYASDFQDSFTDKAIFGEVTFNATDVWQITGGFRIFEQDYKVEEQGGLLFVPGGTANTSNSLDTSDQLFKLNTSYSFGDHMVYATWSEGFRRGGANALGAFGTPETSLYVPDAVTNYEIGIKGLIDDRIEYTLGYFYLDWKNFQLATVCSDFLLLCTVTGGDASSQGIEAEVNAQVSDSLRIMAGYAYIDASLDAPGAVLAPSPRRNVIPGVQLPGSPKHSGSITLLYSTELNNDWSLDGNATFSYSGEKRNHINELQNTMIDGAGIVNASIAVSNENWTVRLFASNLFNNTSRLSVASFQAAKKQSVSRRPRTVGLSVQFRM